MDEVFLTELGQSQLTETTLGFDADDIFYSEDDELNGFVFYKGECQGCDLFTTLNDMVKSSRSIDTGFSWHKAYLPTAYK